MIFRLPKLFRVLKLHDSFVKTTLATIVFQKGKREAFKDSSSNMITKAIQLQSTFLEKNT